MNYRGKKVAITGVPGFIGSALADRLEQLIKPESDNSFDVPGQYKFVKVLEGDVRDPKTFKNLDHTFDYLFHFGAPSSQVLFGRQPAYCIESTLKGLMNAADAARRHGIRLIYPSTGLLSQGKFNEYAMCKKISEDYISGLGIDALGIRIFATYGPGEGHKADYASVPYLFARDMVEGRAPEVFGKGNQVRDFIYITDVVEAIVQLAERCHDDVIDLGSGKPISFNHILKELKVLTGGPDPVYVEAPGTYVMETGANPAELHKYYVPRVTFAEGLARLVDHLRGDRELPVPAKKSRKKEAVAV